MLCQMRHLSVSYIIYVAQRKYVFHKEIQGILHWGTVCWTTWPLWCTHLVLGCHKSPIIITSANSGRPGGVRGHLLAKVKINYGKPKCMILKCSGYISEKSDTKFVWFYWIVHSTDVFVKMVQLKFLISIFLNVSIKQKALALGD